MRAAGAEPVFYELSHDTGFGYETVCDRLLKMTVQMLFLCNPNNPTGNTIPEQILTEILQFCASKKSVLSQMNVFCGFTRIMKK